MSAKSFTLQEYPEGADAAGNIDHSIRARVDASGVVSFYIHPSGADGETMDFTVKGNVLTPVIESAASPMQLSAELWK